MTGAKAQTHQNSFLFICHVICYGVIEETAHVIEKSQCMWEEGARMDEWRNRRGGKVVCVCVCAYVEGERN